MPTSPAPEPKVTMPEPQVREHPARSFNGLAVLIVAPLILLASLAAVFWGIALAADQGQPLAGPVTAIVVGALVAIGCFLSWFGFMNVAPGQARVVQLFGHYTGTVRTNGLRWVNPFTTRKKISARIRNHETAVLKVNDAYGNPIQLAAVVVWQVVDTARALFEVDNFERFVAIQTEAAVRHIAMEYPYDANEEDRLSLRENADEITERLSTEITTRVEAAGVRIIESRITHLAYAPEIAAAMLQRQQAGAVVAARQRIVDGAVGMVEMALARIAEQDLIELDEERKAAMVSNLMVVLCGDRAPQPVVNTGTLYQ